MRNKLFFLSTVASSIVLNSSAQGASTISYNFEPETLGDLFAGEVSGWSQDSPNPSAFGVISPLAYIDRMDFGSGLTNTGNLGTERGNTPDNSPTTLTGAFGLSSTIPGSFEVSLNLAILDSPNDAFTGRDSFAFALFSSDRTPMAEIIFLPRNEDELVWDILAGVNGLPLTSTSASISSSAGYLFKVNFAAAATSFYYGSSQGGVANVLIDTRPSVPSTTLGQIEITHTTQDGTNTLNALAFDNIVASVPEPSSAVFVLSSLGLLARRRRSKVSL